MTQKVYNLVKGCIAGTETIAIAIVTYCADPAIAASVNASIVVACAAAVEICGKFVKE